MRLLEFYFSPQITPNLRGTADSLRGGVCIPGSKGLGLSPTNVRVQVRG